MNEIKSILHIIQPGDTLYDLAMKYKTTIKNIMDSNVGINTYNLKIGQQIYIYISRL